MLLDLAAAVHRHRVVDVVEDAGAAGGADRAHDLLPVLEVAGIDRELPRPLALAACARHEVDTLQGAAGLGYLGGQLAQRLLTCIQLDADDDGVLGGDRGGGHGPGNIWLAFKTTSWGSVGGMGLRKSGNAMAGVIVVLACVGAGTVQAAKGPSVKLVASPLVSFASNQTNNNGPAVRGPLVFAQCPGNKVLAGAGMRWEYINATSPSNAPAAIIALVRNPNESVGGIGASDTDADASVYRAEATCLPGSLRSRIKLRDKERTFASPQIDNNGSYIQSGVHRANCRNKERLIGWSNAIGTSGQDPGSDAVYEIDSVRMRAKAVEMVFNSDVDATTVTNTLTAVCLRKPGAVGLKVRVRSKSRTFHSGPQVTNGMGVVVSPSVRVKCKKGEGVLSGSSYWRTANPDSLTRVFQLQDIDLARRSVRVRGGSDTNADTATLKAQAVCLSKT